MDFLLTFARDWRTAGLCVLILLDVLTGVWAAIHKGEFAGDKLWQFLKTDVLALGGYALIYVLTEAGLLHALQPLLVNLHLDPSLGPGATEWSVFAVAVGSLLTSARKNVERATGLVLFPRPAPPPTP